MAKMELPDIPPKPRLAGRRGIKVNRSQVVLTIFFIALPLLVFLWVTQSGNFGYFYQWSQQNIYVFILVLFALKTLGIVYPPISGGILTLSSIPFIGWVNAYLVDLVGNIVGSCIAYYLGKKYGFDFLVKLFDEKTVDKFKHVKIKQHREIESVFVLRILGGMVVELVAYGSGLLKIGFSNFFIGSVLSHVVVGIPTYYLAKNIFSTQNLFVSLVISIAALYLLWKLKGRYFE